MAAISPKITRRKVIAAVQADDHLGFCLACGDEVQGVEPDTQKGKCEACGERRVYGAEQLLFMMVS